MLSRASKLVLLKIFSLFSVVRGYNVLVIALAQYLSAIFILAPQLKLSAIILDIYLFILVLASSLAIASGYIINNFYDSQKDLINKPNKSILDRLVSQQTKLRIYFALNTIVTLLMLLISWRAVLYFSLYVFMIWFYSHKVKKYPFIGNIWASLLAILPFFAILLYYKNFYTVIFGHAGFLFLLILIREMVKDLENMRGDLAGGYTTIPILYGEKRSKEIITILTFFTLIPVYILVEIFDVGYMDIYFYISLIVLLFFLIYLWQSQTKKQYLLLHNTLKFLIVAGVFCIILIDPTVLLKKFLY